MAAVEGPVLTMINKRLRALRKKYNRITQMEESVAQGKALNKEQEEVLRSKAAVITLIDEYERLRQPLASAVQEELALAQASSPSPSPSSPPPPPDAVTVPPEEQKDHNLDASLEDLLKLLYFGSLFDVKPQSEYETTMLLRTHERGCCITYDIVTDETTSLLEEKDLDMISCLGSLVLSRPPNSNVSHKNALIDCLQHAKLWLHNSEQPIQPGSSFTYAGLRERLNKIWASNYSTAMPEIKPSLDLADLAAGVGKYVVSQPQGNESAVPAPAPAVYSEVPAPDQSKVDDSDGSLKREIGSSDSSQADEQPQQHEDVPPTNVEPEQLQGDDEQDQRDGESEQQQHTSRRGYHNQRASRGGNGYGGRRGFANGRGGRGGRGGGYQNGRSQYYDSGYYSRGYYNPRGRGGRGGGSYNQSAAGYGGQPSGVELGAS